MQTRIDEVAEGIFRLSAYVPDIAPPAGFTFNHFRVMGEEPLLFHTGLCRMFPALRDAVARLMPRDRLRWICFGHHKADECGAMNEWLGGPRGVRQRGGRPPPRPNTSGAWNARAIPGPA